MDVCRTAKLRTMTTNRDAEELKIKDAKKGLAYHERKQAEWDTAAVNQVYFLYVYVYVYVCVCVCVCNGRQVSLLTHPYNNNDTRIHTFTDKRIHT